MLSIGRRAEKITVVFDGYSSSPKDHDHIRRTKNSCCNIKIQPPYNIVAMLKSKFLDNKHNKNQLIHLLIQTFENYSTDNDNKISCFQCCDDADTSIVKAALYAAENGTVEVSIVFLWDYHFINWEPPFESKVTVLILFGVVSLQSASFQKALNMYNSNKALKN